MDKALDKIYGFDIMGISRPRIAIVALKVRDSRLGLSFYFIFSSDGIFSFLNLSICL